jgi:hypothetical protein
MAPIEKWYGKKTYVGHLHVFGCVSWDQIPDDYQKKLDAKSHGFIMMGYSEDSKILSTV